MKQCQKCNGENFKVLKHYEFHNIYECVNCGFWTFTKIEECCRNPWNIVVVEHIDHIKNRLFYQCTNCGYANRAKCLNKKKYDDKIDSDFDIHKYDDRRGKKNQEQIILEQQFQYFKNSIYYNYYNYLNSDQWKEKRRLVLERDNFICQVCKIAPAENVHHITYDSIYKEPLNVLLSVCRPCHIKIHKSYFFNDGKVGKLK